MGNEVNTGLPPATMRLKLQVSSVKRNANREGAIETEDIKLNAVYDDRKGSANKQWCEWTPFGDFSFTVSNPAALGKLLPGQFYFVDLIPTDKDGI